MQIATFKRIGVPAAAGPSPIWIIFRYRNRLFFKHFERGAALLCNKVRYGRSALNRDTHNELRRKSDLENGGEMMRRSKPENPNESDAVFRINFFQRKHRNIFLIAPVLCSDKKMACD
jgi:hypothetical protein